MLKTLKAAILTGTLVLTGCGDTIDKPVANGTGDPAVLGTVTIHLTGPGLRPRANNDYQGGPSVIPAGVDSVLVRPTNPNELGRYAEAPGVFGRQPWESLVDQMDAAALSLAKVIDSLTSQWRGSAAQTLAGTARLYAAHLTAGAQVQYFSGALADAFGAASNTFARPLDVLTDRPALQTLISESQTLIDVERAYEEQWARQLAALAAYHAPATATITVPNVPTSVTSLDIDYLRNSGYAIYEDRENIVWNGTNGTIDAPTPGPAVPSTSNWIASVDARGLAHLQVSTEGGVLQEILLRGVAYSPAPIGSSNKDAPGFGDLFWDTPGGFRDWEKVWKRDLENIRSRGFNCLRTYSLIAHFLNDDGTIPSPAEFANVNSTRVRQHLKFLDACWNDGDHPLFVLVGIPMSSKIFLKGAFENPANASEIRFWDDNFTATVEQLKNHPAVLGFTICNDVGEKSDYSGDAAKATHYWSQIKKYSQRAKEIAPDKLIGWAFSDDSGFSTSTLEYRKQYAQSVDFYGVNMFQATEVASRLDHYQKSKQGETARPVLVTEFGLPATTHADQTTFQPYLEPALSAGRQTIAAREGVSVSDVSPLTSEVTQAFPTEGSIKSISENSNTNQATAEAVGRVISLSLNHPIVAGMMYFEWCDEWWRQDSYAPFQLPNRTTQLVQLAKTAQEGGMPAADFPNGYDDREGYGLNSIRTANEAGVDVQVDALTLRPAILAAVLTAYAQAPFLRAEANR